MGVFHSGTVNQPILTKNEKKVLNGICRYPNITDSELSDDITGETLNTHLNQTTTR